MESLTSSSDWIAVTFSYETLITSLSPGIESFAGCSGSEMIGRPITQFLADRTVYEMPCMLDTVKKEGRWEGEIVYRDCRRNEIKAHGVLIPLSGPEVHNSGYLLQSKLTEFQDLDSGSISIYSEVGSHVRTLVHDLNNPLAVIMGSAQLLALNPGCTGKVRSDIEKLYSELGRMAHVVEKLHGYAISLCERTPDSAAEEHSIQYIVLNCLEKTIHSFEYLRIDPDFFGFFQFFPESAKVILQIARL